MGIIAKTLILEARCKHRWELTVLPRIKKARGTTSPAMWGARNALASKSQALSLAGCTSTCQLAKSQVCPREMLATQHIKRMALLTSRQVCPDYLKLMGHINSNLEANSCTYALIIDLACNPWIATEEAEGGYRIEATPYPIRIAQVVRTRDLITTALQFPIWTSAALLIQA